MKLLLALDQSADAMTAAKFLRGFPVPPESTLILLHVTETPVISGSAQAYDIPNLEQQVAEVRASLRAKALEYLAQVQKLFRSLGVMVQQVVKDGPPSAEIVKVIESEDVDVVVTGSRGLSDVKRFLLGSVSERMLTDAPCSVLIARDRRRTPRRTGMHVLLATDGSEDARAAAGFLKQVRPRAGSVLTVVHVVDKGHGHVVSRVSAPSRRQTMILAQDLLRLRQERGAKLLAETGHEFRRLGWRVRESLLVGHPADQILSACTRVRPDLLVVGSRGLTGLSRFFLGSVSHKVARNAPASILVVRRTRGADSHAS